jgi:hypothetical protein
MEFGPTEPVAAGFDILMVLTDLLPEFIEGFDALGPRAVS